MDSVRRNEETILVGGKNKRRENILRVALDAFHRNGYSQTSVREIAEASEMSVAGLYYHFKSKDEILFNLLDDLKDRLLEELRAARDSVDRPQDRVKAILRAVVKLTIERRAEIRVQLDNFDRLSEEWQSILLEKTRLSVLIVVDELKRMEREGLLRDLNLNLVTFAMYGMTNWIYYWYDPQGEIDFESLVDQLSQILFSGIMAK